MPGPAAQRRTFAVREVATSQLDGQPLIVHAARAGRRRNAHRGPTTTRRAAPRGGRPTCTSRRADAKLKVTPQTPSRPSRRSLRSTPALYTSASRLFSREQNPGGAPLHVCAQAHRVAEQHVHARGGACARRRADNLRTRDARRRSACCTARSRAPRDAKRGRVRLEPDDDGSGCGRRARRAQVAQVERVGEP